MATTAAKTLETPQRVRQFVVRQTVTFPHEVGAADSSEAGSADSARCAGAQDAPDAAAEGFVKGLSPDAPSIGSGGNWESRDLPVFLRRRSLRRRLDDAYESCYRSSVTDWFGEWIGNIFRK